MSTRQEVETPPLAVARQDAILRELPLRLDWETYDRLSCAGLTRAQTDRAINALAERGAVTLSVSRGAVLVARK